MAEIKFNSEFCEPLKGRLTDAKNRVHVGAIVSDALYQGKTVFIVVGEIVEEVKMETENR